MRRAVATVLLCLAAAAGAEERITDFAAAIAIGADGEITVTETIAVEVEGQAIRRGILRDFPTEYRDRLGNKVRASFDVVDVKRNGAAENHAVEKLDNGVRLRIGSRDVLLPRGQHTYAITYRTARQLGFFERHDELYWNVTGNGWTFAIDRARARVVLPRQVPAAQLTAEGYTGPQGARGSDYRAQVFAGGAEFEATRRLAPNEGLTIVLGFPKGVVAAPTALDDVTSFLRDNIGAGVAGAGLLLVFGFLYRRWDRIGRDPKPGPLHPRYEPPRELGAPGGAAARDAGSQRDDRPMSPAAVRFVDRMNADGRCFAAALLGLGARGILAIDQRDDGFTLRRSGRAGDFGPGERAMVDRLFGGRNDVTIGRKYDPSVAAAQKALYEGLESSYEGTLFKRNRRPLLAAVAAGAAVLWAAWLFEASAVVLIATAVLLAAAMIAGGILLPAYSLQGRRLQDEIEGLRQYLGVAEGDSLARMQAPELTPEEFARQLPYALALDVEKTWADRFAALLGAAAAAQAVSGYYRGSDFNVDAAGGIGALSRGLDAMSATVSSASTPPGSSSGSGGGGSSGGGGGGGGGSGW